MSSRVSRRDGQRPALECVAIAGVAAKVEGAQLAQAIIYTSYGCCFDDGLVYGYWYPADLVTVDAQLGPVHHLDDPQCLRAAESLIHARQTGLSSVRHFVDPDDRLAKHVRFLRIPRTWLCPCVGTIAVSKVFGTQ